MGIAVSYTHLEARAGSWDHYGGMLDAGGALNADGSLRGQIGRVHV